MYKMNEALGKVGKGVDEDSAWQQQCGAGAGVCRLAWQGVLIELGMDGTAELYIPALWLFLLPGTEGRPQSRQNSCAPFRCPPPRQCKSVAARLADLPVFRFASPTCTLCLLLLVLEH